MPHAAASAENVMLVRTQKCGSRRGDTRRILTASGISTRPIPQITTMYGPIRRLAACTAPTAASPSSRPIP